MTQKCHYDVDTTSRLRFDVMMTLSLHCVPIGLVRGAQTPGHHRRTRAFGPCGEERRHKWRAVEEEEASTSGPLQRGLLT